MSQKEETQLIKDIREFLAYQGAVTTRVNAGLTVLGKKEEGDQRVIRGAEKGTSDILCCFRGWYVAIEAKVKPNKPTADQLQFLADVRQAGGIGIVAYSLDDVDRGLDIGAL